MFGLQLGAALSVLAALRALFSPGLLPKMGTSFGQVAAAYLIGMPVCGALVGMLLRFGSTPPRAFLVGAVAITPMALAGRIALRGFSPWNFGDTFTLLVVSLVIGGGGSALGSYWSIKRSGRR
jgi:hypothetical protein